MKQEKHKKEETFGKTSRNRKSDIPKHLLPPENMQEMFPPRSSTTFATFNWF
jgi:hypothetical protein